MLYCTSWNRIRWQLQNFIQIDAFCRYSRFPKVVLHLLNLLVSYWQASSQVSTSHMLGGSIYLLGIRATSKHFYAMSIAYIQLDLFEINFCVWQWKCITHKSSLSIFGIKHFAYQTHYHNSNEYALSNDKEHNLAFGLVVLYSGRPHIIMVYHLPQEMVL